MGTDSRGRWAKGSDTLEARYFVMEPVTELNGSRGKKAVIYTKAAEDIGGPRSKEAVKDGGQHKFTE